MALGQKIGNILFKIADSLGLVFSSYKLQVMLTANFGFLATAAANPGNWSCVKVGSLVCVVDLRLVPFRATTIHLRLHTHE